MVRISNLELANMLRKDARATYSAMAKRLKVSETAVRKRMKSLEQKGVIRGYITDVDFRKLGLEVHALIGLDAMPESYFAVMERLKKDKDVDALYSSSGDHMLMVDAHMKDSAALAQFVKRMQGMKGVTKVCPAIMLERIK